MNYDKICALIGQCVNSIDYTVFADMSKVIIIVINEEKRFLKCIDQIITINPKIELVLVVQPSMKGFLKQKYSELYQVIEWVGKYTLGLIDVLVKEIRLKDVDSFLFFSEQSINMRDQNFMQIAEQIIGKENSNLRVFGNTIGDEIFEYKNIRLFNQAIKVYEEMNQLIEIMLE